jgi:hypothetical protein
MWPTPPDAPVMSTREPRIAPPSATRFAAVVPAIGSAAPTSRSTPSGTCASRWVGTTACSAQPCHSASPATRVPAAGPLPSAAGRSTSPATS